MKTIAVNLNSSLTALANTVEGFSSRLLRDKPPLVVSFLQNLGVPALLQTVEAHLLEAASLPKPDLIIGSNEAEFLSSPSESGIQIVGLDGNDTILTSLGNDILFGGKGDEVINPSYGNDIVVGEGGNDEVRGINGNDILFGEAGGDFLNGGPGDDYLSGGPGADFLFSNGDGNSDINGTDILFGGNGDDRLVGDESSDILFGGNGDDIAYGAEGDDLIFGRTGIDLLNGGPGNDIVHGGVGNDNATGADGDDVVYGGLGDDLLFGFSGNDTLSGGKGSDRLTGVDPVFRLFGFGKGETDTLTGKGGRDVFVLGDVDNVYYNDSARTSIGANDYALVTDFNPDGVDKIQLNGSPTDYFLDTFTFGSASGTAIFLQPAPSTGERLPELIGIMAGVSVQSLDLSNLNQFVFVA